MPEAKEVEGNETFDFIVGLALRPETFPPLHLLSLKQISYLANRISDHFTQYPQQNVIKVGRCYKLVTGFYGLTVVGRTYNAVIAKSQARRLWRRKLQGAADAARLNFEAKNKTVGGAELSAELYASDVTVTKAREKKIETEKYLAGQVMVNASTGERISLSKLARKAEVNRFNELYWISKNLEAIAAQRGMGWLFLTFTAPPKFHPNPLKGKCSYDPELGVRASHSFISSAWSRVRALLYKRGIKGGIDSYFGIRTAETHKDGSVHWHLLVFITSHLADMFVDTSAMQFPGYGQMKVEVGDPKIGSAASYIFKYLAKGFDPSVVGEMADSDVVLDCAREDSDLASLRNGERVRAALKAMRIRQYQTFGVKNVLSLVRAINKLGSKELQELEGHVPEIVRTEIWRNPTGLKYILENEFLVVKIDGEAPLMLLKEAGLSAYGEEIASAVGLKIGIHTIRTKGRYEVHRV